MVGKRPRFSRGHPAAVASLVEPCRRRESRADDGRAVPTTGKPCRRRESRADDGRAVPTRGKGAEVGREVPMSAEMWRGQHGRGAAGKDVVPPGWTWCRRDGRGAAGMDVVPPGWTCSRPGRRCGASVDRHRAVQMSTGPSRCPQGQPDVVRPIRIE